MSVLAFLWRKSFLDSGILLRIANVSIINPALEYCVWNMKKKKCQIFSVPFDPTSNNPEAGMILLNYCSLFNYSNQVLIFLPTFLRNEESPIK